jgi:hypothetical protein
MAKINLDYSNLPKIIGGEGMELKEQSRQFLVWFLQNYYHLEETEAADCVCDNTYDKGIDGIFVDEHLRQIDIFSSSIATKTKGTGDVKPKEFQGSLIQFQSSISVRQLENDTSNIDLKRILKEQEIAKKIEDGYQIYGVYVTNSIADDQTDQYLKHAPHLTLWDKTKLETEYISLDKTPPISKPISFDIRNVSSMEYPVADEVSMVIAPISAAELVEMDGIINNQLFAPNVRYWLGSKTPVNQAIQESIEDNKEHKYFSAFHNGLIVLCEDLEYIEGECIKISNYSVANGCQSLRGFYENRGNITPELRIFTKFFKLPTDSVLAIKITNRTNNQNGSKPRDFQSNSVTQTRIQSAIKNKYKGEFFYRISRGERPDLKENVIENELAGKLLLAFDLKKPFEANSNVFTDKKHSEIFGRPIVTADRIVILYEISQFIDEARKTKIENRLVANYQLTKFFLVYLLRLALELDNKGKEFIDNPSNFLKAPDDRTRLRSCFEKIIQTLSIHFNSAVKRKVEKDNFFDYKTELKKPELVKNLGSQLLEFYEIALSSGYAPTFSQLWDDSAKNINIAL